MKSALEKAFKFAFIYGLALLAWSILWFAIPYLMLSFVFWDFLSIGIEWRVWVAAGVVVFVLAALDIEGRSKGGDE